MAKTKAILVRVTPAEKALIEEKAKASGLSTSDYLRQLGMGTRGSGRKTAAVSKTTAPGSTPGSPVDLEARVRELSQRMPRRNAEVLARRELRRAA